MSKNYAKVKNWYDHGNWSIARVYNAVGKWITADEFEKIVGKSIMEYEQEIAEL